MVLLVADKELSVTRNISSHKREVIRMRGSAFLLLNFTANKVLTEVFENFSIDDSFSIDIYLYSSGSEINVELNERGCIPLNGDLTISKGNGSGSFRGEALLNRDLWMQMSKDISNSSKNYFSINCDYVDGVVKIQDSNTITCKVQMSMIDYSIDYTNSPK